MDDLLDENCMNLNWNRYMLESDARESHLHPIVGVDEAGRGPLAGPVVVCACSLPDTFPFHEVKDSKQLSEKVRERLYGFITTYPGVVYTLQVISETVIDQINILQATLLGMKQAVESLPLIPEVVFIDGPILPKISYKAHAIVSGDVLCPSISAASIVAKVHRDRLISAYDTIWPEWRFSVHKGYGTAYHRAMLEKHGFLPVHRRSFEPIKSMIASTA